MNDVTERGFQGGFRQSMSWLHTWTGLVLSVVLYFVFLTGAAGYFNTEIDRWMRPEQPAPAAVTPSQNSMIQLGLARLQQQAPEAKNWYVNLPQGRRHPHLSITATPKPQPGVSAERFRESLDAATGAPHPAVRETGGGRALYVMHYALHYLPYMLAVYIVGIATMFMLVAIVSGVIVHKKIFADFFTFRPGKGQRSWLDAHNLTSVMALPFLVMITYSGLVFYTYDYMPSVRAALYGLGDAGKDAQRAEREGGEAFFDTKPAGRAAPLTPIEPLLAQAAVSWGEGRIRFVGVINPGDANARIQIGRTPKGDINPEYPEMWFDGVSGALLRADRPPKSGADHFSTTIIALHEGHFAGPVLRWLYFASGLLSAAMIATGLVLWTTKRRQWLGRNGVPDAGLRFVEHFNVGIVVGLPIAIAAYFWANRLLPVGMPGREPWEMHVLFAVWALALAHAALRPTARAWREQLLLACALYALLPLLNALTTEVHLGRTLPAGDWVLAGFDVTMFALAAMFGWIAWRLLARGRIVEIDRKNVALDNGLGRGAA